VLVAAGRWAADDSGDAAAPAAAKAASTLPALSPRAIVGEVTDALAVDDDGRNAGGCEGAIGLRAGVSAANDTPLALCAPSRARADAGAGTATGAETGGIIGAGTDATIGAGLPVAACWRGVAAETEEPAAPALRPATGDGLVA